MRQLLVAVVIILSEVVAFAQQTPTSKSPESANQPLQLSVTDIKLITSEPVGRLLVSNAV